MKKSILVCLLVSTVCYGADQEERDFQRAIAASLGQTYGSQVETDAEFAARLQREEEAEAARIAALHAEARRTDEDRVRRLTALEGAQRQVALKEAARLAEQQRRDEIRGLRTALRDVAHGHARVIRGVAQGSDVHVLDSYIEANLSGFVAQVRAALPYLEETENLYFADMDRLRYDIFCLTPEQFSYRDPDGGMKEISRDVVNQHVSVALNKVGPNSEVFSLYSLHMAIVESLRTRTDVSANMLEFINAICENYETQGGCFEGVRNRGFIRLVSLLLNYFDIMRV